jgi:hypothetical protein
MPALSFQAQFAPAVEAGTKRQTIRARRKDGRDPKQGDLLYLYTGMRTKACRKLGEAVCRSARPICLRVDRSYGIELDGVPLTGHECEDFARADGFGSYDEMMEWFSAQGRGFPWRGLVISWLNI